MDLSMIVELLSNLRQFRAREHWTRKLLEEHQAQAVRDYAYAHSPRSGKEEPSWQPT